MQTSSLTNDLKQELIEMFLSENVEHFEKQFKRLIDRTPNNHPVSYDDFFIYFFLGSISTLPSRLTESICIKEGKIYFKLELNSKGINKGIKVMKFFFEVDHNNSQVRKLVSRVIAVSSKKGNFKSEYYSPDDIKHISENLNLIPANVQQINIDSKILSILVPRKGRKVAEKEGQKVTETEQEVREVKLEEDQALKTSLLQNVIQNTSILNQGQSTKECFKTIDLREDNIIKQWFCAKGNSSSSSRFEDSLSDLSEKDTGKVERAVKEIFTSFTEIYDKRRKDTFLLDISSTQYKESRFHGFTYGSLVLNYKYKYHLTCHIESFSGSGGGSDLLLTSRKPKYGTVVNLHFIPVIIEFKIGKSGGYEEAKSNILSVLPTFSDKAVVVSVDPDGKNGGKINIKKEDVPQPRGLIASLLDSIGKDKNILFNDIKNDIKKELECLHYSIPLTQRINHHTNYFSRLVLGEILANESLIEKYAFIYDDKDMIRYGNQYLVRTITTLLIRSNNQGSQNLAIILNVIEYEDKVSKGIKTEANKCELIKQINEPINPDGKVFPLNKDGKCDSII